MEFQWEDGAKGVAGEGGPLREERSGGKGGDEGGGERRSVERRVGSRGERDEGGED